MTKKTITIEGFRVNWNDLTVTYEIVSKHEDYFGHPFYLARNARYSCRLLKIENTAAGWQVTTAQGKKRTIMRYGSIIRRTA